jgi:hypothetical protein
MSTAPPQNSKSEARNPKQTPKRQIQMLKTALTTDHVVLNIFVLNLLFVSDFVLRISNLPLCNGFALARKRDPHRTNAIGVFASYPVYYLTRAKARLVRGA